MSLALDFDLFLVLWNRLQGRGTPSIHVRIARWLSRRRAEGDNRLLLMAFRGCGKSTIAGLYAAWLLGRNPELRLLVLAADHTLATRMVHNVKRIVERHPLLAHLKPERPDEWAADRFTVRRRGEWREPSMRAQGLHANLTGGRADLVICDDVEVPNSCDTPEKRADLRRRLIELEYVMVPGASLLYLGTPHTAQSIYACENDAAAGRHEAFLAGFRRLVLPIADAAGAPLWPERFPRTEIDRLRRAAGPRTFAAQMLLQPVPVSEGRLDPGLLGRYTEELDYGEAQGRPVLRLGERRLISASAWWDPAFGHGDGSVLAVLFADATGALFVHEMVWITPDPGQPEDNASQQCRAVARIAKRCFLPSVAVEINGIGRFLPGLLRREMAAAGLGCAVVEKVSTRPKSLRILEAFDAVLAARRLALHARVWASPLIEEMRGWKPGGAGHDDGLDALAGALSAEPIRLGPAPAIRRPTDWRPGASTTAITNDFNPLEQRS